MINKKNLLLLAYVVAGSLASVGLSAGSCTDGNSNDASLSGGGTLHCVIAGHDYGFIPANTCVLIQASVFQQQNGVIVGVNGSGVTTIQAQ